MLRQIPRKARWLVAGVLTLCVLLLVSTVPVTRAETDAPAIKVEFVNNEVQAGDNLELWARVDNDMDEEVVRVDITIPYNTQILTPVDSEFEEEDDSWVSEIADGQVTLTFEEVEEDETRYGTLVFAVDPATPDYTELDYKADYMWWTATRSDGGETEDFEALVLNPNEQTQTSIAPQAGPAGTVFEMYASRFQPDEGVVTWLNTPTGVQSLDLHGLTNNTGEIWLRYDSSGLAPGNYSIVLRGKESGREYALPFTITS